MMIFIGVCGQSADHRGKAEHCLLICTVLGKAGPRRAARSSLGCITVPSEALVHMLCVERRKRKSCYIMFILETGVDVG